MIHLNFSRQQMIDSLKKIGYDLTFEDDVDYRHYNHVVQEIPVKVWVVRYKGVSMAVERGFGDNRLTYVFEHELQKRLLKNLF